MTPQFLALIGPASPNAGPYDTVQRRAEHQFGMRQMFVAPDLIVLAGPQTPVVAIGEQDGVALGTVFSRVPNLAGEYTCVQRMDGCGPDLEALMADYWGRYVAIVVKGGGAGIEVARDPSGGFACCFSRWRGRVMLYGDVGMAQALGIIAGEPDVGGLLQLVAFPAMPSARTAIVGVEDLQPGTGLKIDHRGRVSRTLPWTPRRFTQGKMQVRDRRTAIDLVQAEARRCVSAWGALSQSILLELSGGLDSSIVAACLRDQAEKLTLVTLATPDPGADERAYALEVADSLKRPLRTLTLDVNDARLEPPRALTARPCGGALHQTIDAALLRSADGQAVDAFFSGGGGDNVFCYLSSAAPATDVLLCRGPGLSFAPAVADRAVLHGCTTWTAGRRALRKLRRGAGAWRNDLDFLAPGAPTRTDQHPWLATRAISLPGQREHLMSLLSVQTALTGHRRESLAPVLFPLLSQPLVELCLRIPSWFWIDGGRNRAIARDAFMGQLPLLILQRRTKGNFLGMLGAIYRQQRPELRDLLLGGWLAEQALIDRPAIEAYLESEALLTDVRFCRVLDLANVELWARAWLARRGSP